MALEKRSEFSCAMMILVLGAQAVGQEFEVASIEPSPPVDYTAPGRLYGCLEDRAATIRGKSIAFMCPR